MSELSTPGNRPVAFFDFDGTLTTGDTLMPFLKFIVGTPAYYAKLALVIPVLRAYFARLLRNDITKRIVLKHYLAGYRADELFRLGNEFASLVLPTMMRPEGIERLRWHQDQKHECVLVSASIDIYLETWVKREHFTDAEIERLRNRRSVYQTARATYSRALGEQLQDVQPVTGH